MQVRLATPITSEEYINGKLWVRATLRCCPWHPLGGCGFARHGTYTRVKPANTRVARWYCPQEKCTISALPDCLASHRSGTLNECEAVVCTVENAISIEAACRDLRTEIELPGVLRYVARLTRDITLALRAIKGLFPLRFSGEPTLSGFSQQLQTQTVLMDLRSIAADFLPQLPTPLGFNPSPHSTHTRQQPFQHRVGRDPPVAFIEAIG
jgi:hypothetical protein